VYYFAVHYYGYEKGEDGRVHKKVKKRYLGPSVYVEVGKTHNNLGLTLKGLIEERRERDYMEALVRSVRDRIRGGRLTAEGPGSSLSCSPASARSSGSSLGS